MSQTVEWLKQLECEGGGIAERPGGRPYPEVSGYLIPTFYDYSEPEIAHRLADWLLKIQREDGSFPDASGYSRTFDSVACAEGLFRAGKEIRNNAYTSAALRAIKWVKSLERPDGAMLTAPGHDKTHLYTLRVSGMIGSKRGGAYWQNIPWGIMRTHYAAYALEGLWQLGDMKAVKSQLKEARDLFYGIAPFWVNPKWEAGWGSDICATAQLGILFIKAGIPAGDLFDATLKMVRPDGGIPQLLNSSEVNSWTAKWCLDFWRLAGKTL